MLASIEDVETYMGSKFDAIQKRAATGILDGLHSELRAFLNRPLEVGTFSETHVIPWKERALPGLPFYDEGTTFVPVSGYSAPVTVYLNNSPVTEVVTVYRGYTTSASVAPTLLRVGADYVVRKFGIDLMYADVDDEITVEYSAGLEGETIKILKSLIIRAAVRELTYLTDDSFSVRDLQPQKERGPREFGFTERELKSVERYKRRRI